MRKHQEKGYVPLTFTNNITDFATGVKPVLHDSASFRGASLSHEQSIGVGVTLLAALHSVKTRNCAVSLIWAQFRLSIFWKRSR